MQTLNRLAIIFAAILLAIVVPYILDERKKDSVLILAETHPTVKAIATKELNIYFEPLPQYASESVPITIAAISETLTNWSPYGATVKRVYAPQQADMTITWVRDYGYHALGQSIYGAHIKVGLGTTNCYGEWMAFDGNTVGNILWHEVGHSMGYGHSDNQENIMFPETATRFEVDLEISEVLAPGWYGFFPFCNAGTYSYYFETDDPSYGFEISVLRPGADPDNPASVIDRNYADCGSGVWQQFRSLCTVEDGAAIHIHNPNSSEAIRISGQVISLAGIAQPDMEWDPEVFLYETEVLQEYNDILNKRSGLLDPIRRLLD